MFCLFLCIIDMGIICQVNLLVFKEFIGLRIHYTLLLTNVVHLRPDFIFKGFNMSDNEEGLALKPFCMALWVLHISKI